MTSLNLDPRQRAMLAEMHVRVWAPAWEPDLVPEPHAAESTGQNAGPAVGTSPVELGVAAPQGHDASANKPSTFAEAADLAAFALPAASATSAARSPVSVPSPRVATTAPVNIQRPEGLDQMDWSTLQATVASCQACSLCGTRKNTVFGVGGPIQEGQAPKVDWLIVGETPGEAEDAQGEPFVGAAGELLDNMLRACGQSRTGPLKGAAPDAGGVFITNVLKCSPPGNRNPKREEAAQCTPYLQQQVALLKPKVIVAMGRVAIQALLQDTVPELDTTPLGKLRGQVRRYQGVPVVVTYHPAYVLRNLPEKAKVWADLCLAMAQISDQP
jgi:uracil-DNA glycosylase family 4